MCKYSSLLLQLVHCHNDISLQIEQVIIDSNCEPHFLHDSLLNTGHRSTLFSNSLFAYINFIKLFIIIFQNINYKYNNYK